MSVIWSKFFWQDWESDPAVRLCSLAAQGLWMRMLCIAAAHDPIGYVAVAGRGLDETSIARLTGCQESEVISLLGELDRNGVFSRDRQGRIYSRRMIRDARKAATAQKNGKKGGNPSLSKTTGFSPSDNLEDKAGVKPQEPEARSQKKPSSLRSEDTSESEFEIDFWPVYPRKAGKGQALKAFRAARKRADLDVILAGARRYASERSGEDPNFTRHAATWLNGQGWLDEPASRRGAQSRSPPPAMSPHMQRQRDIHQKLKRDLYGEPDDEFAGQTVDLAERDFRSH